MNNQERQELRRWSADDLLGCEVVFKQYPRSRWWYKLKGKRLCHINNWIPDDPNAPARQIQMVIDKMRELGFNFNFNWQGHPGITISIAQFHKFDTGKMEHGQGSDDEPLIAILRAAKAAWEAMKGETA